MVSTPPTTMDPARRPTSPRIDLRVEVRPAPLRPRSVTTSPLFTLKSTPCSTCDSPYHAWRSFTRRTSPAPDRFCPGSGMRRSHIRLDHLRVRRDFRVRALGDDRAALQHGDRV